MAAAVAVVGEDDANGLHSSFSQTSASIHSGSNSHVLSLSELNDLALRGPEPGQINYYFLHQVIDAIIKELGIEEQSSMVLESYVSVDDAYLVPQSNSNTFNNNLARRSNASLAAAADGRRRSSALRMVDLHASKSQTERPGSKKTDTLGTPANAQAARGGGNLTSNSAVAVTGAKSAPSIAATKQHEQSYSAKNAARNEQQTSTATGAAAANPPAAAPAAHAHALDHQQESRNHPSPSPSPALTDASGYSTGSRRGSPKDKVGVIVNKHQQQQQPSPLNRALSKSNLPPYVGGSPANNLGQQRDNNGNISTPLNRRDSGTSTNTTTIKVYNAVPPPPPRLDQNKKNSLSADEQHHRPIRDSGVHVRARLERLERFVQHLLAKGGAASADQIKSILEQIEALGGGPKHKSIDPDEVFERLADAESRLRHLAKIVVDLQTASNKFSNFLDTDDDATDTVPLKLTSSEITRKACQAQSDAQLAHKKLSNVESKVDDGLALAKAERRALAEKAEAIAADMQRAKADRFTAETMDNMLKSHLAGIVSWGELDDALQEMRESFARFSMGALNKSDISGAAASASDNAVARGGAAPSSLASAKSKAAGGGGNTGRAGAAAAQSKTAVGGKSTTAVHQPNATASTAALGGPAEQQPAGTTAEARGKSDAQKQQAYKRAASKDKKQKGGGAGQADDVNRNQQEVDPQQEGSSSSQQSGKKRYRHISAQDKEDENDEQQRQSLADRAARREEINARAAAWSAAKASRGSPGLDSSADSSDAESNISPQSLSPQDPALIRSKENVFRQLEQLSRTGKTLPSVLDDMQVRLEKAATQAQVNSIIDEIASDLALQNQRIEQLADRIKFLEDQMRELARLTAQQAAVNAVSAVIANVGGKPAGADQTNDPNAAGKTEAQLLAQRLLDAQRERDIAKKLLDQELSRASAELLKKVSNEDTTAAEPSAEGANGSDDAAKLQLSDEWLKLQEHRIQNLLDRIDALRAECEGDRTELFSTLNVMGSNLKDLQRNYSKLSKQLQEASGAGGSGWKQGGGRGGKRGGRSNSQNPFAEDELDDLINECQNDIETLKVVVKELALKDGELDKAIEAIMELIERLQETKADKSIISTLLSTKADKKALETKISRSTFEMLETKWQGLLESMSDKLEALEKDMRIQKNRRAHDYASFATRAELRPLQDAINCDMRILKEQLERVIRVLELEEAAAVRKSWMRCIACDRKCDMPDHAQHPSVPYLPPMPLMAASSVEAYTAQHLAAAAMAAQGDSGGAGAARSVAVNERATMNTTMKLGSDKRTLNRYEQLLIRKDTTRNLMNSEVAYKNAYNSTQHKRDQHYSQERPVGGFHTLVASASKSPKPGVGISRSSEQHRALEQ